MCIWILEDILTGNNIPSLELKQILFCLIQRDDFLQVSHHLLDVLPADKAGGGADLMDDTALQAALGIHRPDCFRMWATTWVAFCGPGEAACASVSLNSRLSCPSS